MSALLGVEGNQEEVIEDEELCFFEFFQLRLDCSFVFCDFQGAHQFGGVCVKNAYAGLAGLVSQCCCQVAFSRAGTTGDEQVVSLADELLRGEPFHLVAVQPTRQRIVDLRHRCVTVSEVLLPGARCCVQPDSPIFWRAASSGSCQESLSRRKWPEDFRRMRLPCREGAYGA